MSGTYLGWGEADLDGTMGRFQPVQFSDLSGALAIATYWADAHQIPVVHLLSKKKAARLVAGRWLTRLFYRSIDARR